MVGLDRAAAKAAFAEFLDDKRYSRNQIEFVNLIIDELSSTGVIEARRVYESPYDGLAPEGPEAIFVEADLADVHPDPRQQGDGARRGQEQPTIQGRCNPLRRRGGVVVLRRARTNGVRTGLNSRLDRVVARSFDHTISLVEVLDL